MPPKNSSYSSPEYSRQLTNGSRKQGMGQILTHAQVGVTMAFRPPRFRNPIARPHAATMRRPSSRHGYADWLLSLGIFDSSTRICRSKRSESGWSPNRGRCFLQWTSASGCCPLGTVQDQPWQKREG